MMHLNPHKALITLAATASLAACCIAECAAVVPAIYKRGDITAASHWADSVLATLNMQEKIAQLMMPVVAPYDTLYIKQNLNYYISKLGVGGLLVSKGSAEQYAGVVNSARKMSRVPLLIAVDGEWGVAMRVTDALTYPRNLALGAIADDKLLYEYGKQVARQCKALGINVNFAPVMDVNSNPDNPVIGDRSFGELPMNVAAKGVAFAKGLEDGGVLSVAKHFPGHGSTTEDSHRTLPIVNKSASEMQICDLIPFKKYIDAGLGGILTAHIQVPALGTKPGTPASFSPEITGKLLHGTLGFEGLTFTDALTMKGAVAGISPCVAALKAGNDILLEPANAHTEIQNIAKAINRGELDSAIVIGKVRRVLIYKYLLGAATNSVASANPLATINDYRARELKTRLTDAAVTVVHDPKKLIGNRKANVISVTPAYSAEMLRNEIGGKDNVILVFYMNPYKIAGYATVINESNAAVIVAYYNTAEAHEAVSHILQGENKPSETLPVTITGVAKARRK